MKAKLILIGVGAAVLITAVWYFALWSPKGTDLEEAQAAKVAAEQRESELQARLAHLKILEKNADVLERDRAKFAAAMPTADELDNFILQVNERATQSGVLFAAIAPTEPQTGSQTPGAATATGPTPIGLQMQVSGDYFAILRFLESLRDGQRLVTVENFSLSKGENNNMSATIGGRMFIAPSVVVPTATPTSTPAG